MTHRVHKAKIEDVQAAHVMFKSLLISLGLMHSEEEQRMIDLIQKCPYNIRIGERGSLRIDPREVRNSKEFKEALIEAKQIVRRQQ